MTICVACDRAIPRHHPTHWWHHEGCPNRTNGPTTVDCTCELPYHAECCPRPDCQPTPEAVAVT